MLYLKLKQDNFLKTTLNKCDYGPLYGKKSEWVLQSWLNNFLSNYRITSNKRPGRLFNFFVFRRGVYSRGAFIKLFESNVTFLEQI